MPGTGAVSTVGTEDVQPPNQAIDGGSTAATDPDAERRALVEARSRRRLVKNLVLASICVALLVATLWVLLAVGPL